MPFCLCRWTKLGSKFSWKKIAGFMFKCKINQKVTLKKKMHTMWLAELRIVSLEESCEEDAKKDVSFKWERWYRI